MVETGGGLSLQTENHRARWSPWIPSPAAHWDLEGREVRDPSLGTPTQGYGWPGPGISNLDCKLFFLLLCAWASENGDVLAAPGVWESRVTRGDTEASDTSRVSDQAGTAPCP